MKGYEIKVNHVTFDRGLFDYTETIGIIIGTKAIAERYIAKHKEEYNNMNYDREKGLYYTELNILNE